MEISNTLSNIDTSKNNYKNSKLNTPSFKDSLNDSIENLDNREISKEDENDAVFELFKLTKMLLSGVVDYDLLKEGEATNGTRPGEKRELVEKLKMAIRSIIREEKPENGESLEDIIDSFPSEIQELLHSAFPKLKELIELEKERAKEDEDRDGDEVEKSKENTPEEITSIEQLNLLKDK